MGRGRREKLQRDMVEPLGEEYVHYFHCVGASMGSICAAESAIMRKKSPKVTKQSDK